jgi:hypothetical protein
MDAHLLLPGLPSHGNFIYLPGIYSTIMRSNVKIIRPNTRSTHAPDLEWIERFARLLDSRFLIPGTKIRFGIDPVFSLFPVLGDLITYIISGALIYVMHHQGASRNVVIKMILNSTLDAVIGTIPIVGTIFDIFYRANDRNVRLLREHYVEGKHQGSGTGLLVLIAIIAVLLVGATCYGMYKLFEAIF